MAHMCITAGGWSDTYAVLWQGLRFDGAWLPSRGGGSVLLDGGGGEGVRNLGLNKNRFHKTCSTIINQ